MRATRAEQRFFESRRGRVVTLLRLDSQTVEDLAEALGTTDDAVRAPLATLERDGRIRQHGVRRGAGKPAHSYELTQEADRLLPKPCAPALRQLLDVLSERMQPEQLGELMRAVGRRLAPRRVETAGDQHPSQQAVQQATAEATRVAARLVAEVGAKGCTDQNRDRQAHCHTCARRCQADQAGQGAQHALCLHRPSKHEPARRSCLGAGHHITA